MNVCDASLRERIHHSLVAVNPSLIEHIMHLTVTERLDCGERGLSVGLLHLKAHLASGFPFEQRVILLSGLYLFAVDGKYDVAYGHPGLFGSKRAAGEDFGYLKTVALIGFIEKRTEVGSRKLCPSCRSRCTGVGSVQLTENLAKQNSEVAVVVDIRKELTVMIAIIFPVHPMEVSVIELVIYLTEHMVKDIFTLKRRLAVVFGLKLNILDVAFGKIDLLDTFAGDDEQVLPLLVGSHTAAL